MKFMLKKFKFHCNPPLIILEDIRGSFYMRGDYTDKNLYGERKNFRGELAGGELQ